MNCLFSLGGLGGGGVCGKFGRFLSLLLNKFGGLIGVLFILFYCIDFIEVVLLIVEFFLNVWGNVDGIFLVLFLNKLGGLMDICGWLFLDGILVLFIELYDLFVLFNDFFFFWIGEWKCGCEFSCIVLVVCVNLFILELWNDGDEFMLWFLKKFLKFVGGFNEIFFIVFGIRGLFIVMEEFFICKLFVGIGGGGMFGGRLLKFVFFSLLFFIIVL